MEEGDPSLAQCCITALNMHLVDLNEPRLADARTAASVQSHGGSAHRSPSSDGRLRSGDAPRLPALESSLRFRLHQLLHPEALRGTTAAPRQAEEAVGAGTESSAADVASQAVDRLVMMWRSAMQRRLEAVAEAGRAYLRYLAFAAQPGGASGSGGDDRGEGGRGGGAGQAASLAVTLRLIDLLNSWGAHVPPIVCSAADVANVQCWQVSYGVKAWRAEQMWDSPPTSAHSCAVCLSLFPPSPLLDFTGSPSQLTIPP